MAERYHVSSKACIVKEGKILLIQYKEPHEDFFHYNLPGGKVKPNENMNDACARKVFEETGAEVGSVGNLLFVYEYIGKTHDFYCGDKHSISLVFQCTLKDGSEICMEKGTNLDDIQTDVCWVPIDELDNIVLLPKFQDKLKAVIDNPSCFANHYWGDIL